MFWSVYDNNPYQAAQQNQQEVLNNNPLVSDSEHSAIRNLADELGIKLDSTSLDYLYQYYLGDKASQNAFNRELEADSTKYQRTVADLQKAGISPMLAFDALRGGNVSSTAASISGGNLTSQSNSKRTQQSAIIGVLGLIAAAVIKALA